MRRADCIIPNSANLRPTAQGRQHLAPFSTAYRFARPQRRHMSWRARDKCRNTSVAVVFQSGSTLMLINLKILKNSTI
jgi:hypothetical protein